MLQCAYFDEYKEKLLHEIIESDNKAIAFFELLNNLNNTTARNIVYLIQIILNKN